MSKTPEEYLAEQEFQAETKEREKGLSSQERAFLKKYLGLDEKDLLEKLGIEAPQEPSPREQEEAAALPQEQPRVLEEPEVQPEASAEPEGGLLDAQTVEELFEEEDLLPDIDLAASAAELAEEEEEPEAEPALDARTLAEENPDAFLKSQSEIQLVSMGVGKYEYTMPINYVQEVVRYLEPTAIPEAPSHLAGVVNLRGRVTPVFKLSKILNIDDEQAAGDNKFIVVCKHKGTQFGLLVHTVENMYRVGQNVIEWNIESRIGGNMEIVTGLMKKDDILVGILSISRLVERVSKGSGGRDG